MPSAWPPWQPLHDCGSAIRRKSKRWQRDRMVSGTLCDSVVAKMNLTCGGGSSSVLSSALKAPVREHVDLVHDVDLVAVARGPVRDAVAQLADVVDAVVARRRRSRRTSTAVPRGDLDARVARAAGRAAVGAAVSQFSALARMRAVVVLPTPRAPVKRKAWRDAARARSRSSERAWRRAPGRRCRRRSAGGTCGRGRGRTSLGQASLSPAKWRWLAQLPLGPRRWPATVAPFRAWRGSRASRRPRTITRGPGRRGLSGSSTGGERGIRTLGTFRYTRFPVVHLRPLGHLSSSRAESGRSGERGIRTPGTLADYT